MSFEKKLLEARKRKGIFQDEFALNLGLKGPMIGRYERDKMKPSTVASKMTELLDISLDYLVGKSKVFLDSMILNRIIELQKLSPGEQKTVFSLRDAFLRGTKLGRLTLFTNSPGQ